jgi:hypothetical protein
MGNIADGSWGAFTVTTNVATLNADAVDAITEIASGLKSGADATLITGTAGTNGNMASWNGDGDLVDGPDLLDEDDMASDSATDVATQQSIKAYVDSQAAGSFGTALLHVRNEQSSGAAGGTFTSGAWRTRTLNTTRTNEISGASLGSNQITLPAGDYIIHASATAQGVGDNVVKIRNTTAGSDIIIGMPTGEGSANVNQNSHVRGKFTLGVSSVLELQHRCDSTRSTDGFGKALTYGVVEVYSDVMIWKV